MKKLLNKLSIKFYAHKNLYLSAPLLLGLFNLPLLSVLSPKMPDLQSQAQVAQASVLKADSQSMLVDAFLGSDMSDSDANSILADNMSYVSSRPAYDASLAVIKKHESTIKGVADTMGVPEDVAIGVALLENGGSETAVSKAGALGVFQLMPYTARSLGLVVNKKLDERRDPLKNIAAGITYLKENYERFGDWGLATWAYHAGEGNVAKALQIYAKANQGISLPGVKDSAALKAYVDKYGITIHKLLSDASVKKFTGKLSDDSEGYPYKVLATATLFRQSQGIVQAGGLSQVAER